MADPAPTALFSDVQFTALMAVLSAIGATLAGTLRWAVNRVTKALDDNSTSHREVGKQVADSNLEHAKALVAMTTKVDEIADWVQDHTPISRNTDDERTPVERRGGYGPMKPSTSKG